MRCTRTPVFVLVLVTSLLAGYSSASANDAATANSAQLRDEIRHMITEARDKVFPALVNIDVVTVVYWDGKEHKSRSVGSGTIISAEGHVLTNQHVTNKGKKFTCTLADKQKIPAKLIGEDALTDLAILQLDLSKLKEGSEALPVAKFGDSDQLQIGDYVMAMGSPYALSRSVTLGIVSNSRRVFAGGMGSDDAEDMELESGQRTGLFTQWIQHDALIHPGNSGGPLINLQGEIIGINELGGSSMGFAIPSQLAKKITKELIEHGEVVRSWIGVSFKPIEKTGYDKGVLINSVVKDGPADRAGIEAGDVLVELEGDGITARFAEEAPSLLGRIADLKVGDEIKVAYERNGQRHETTLTTQKLRHDIGDQKAFRSWGITGMAITDKMARDRRLSSTEGVLVTSVRDGSPAALAEPAISPGVVLRMIDNEPITTLDGFVELYERLMADDDLPEYLLVEFDAMGKNHLTLIKPKPDEDEDPPREIPKSWIGIATQPILKKLADELKDKGEPGFRITRVYPRTLAAQSELKVGDIILDINEERMSPRGMHDAGLLARRIRKLDIGDIATMTILRDGEKKKVEVELERTRIEPSEARREQERDFEMTVREVTFFDRDARQWDDEVQGVIVEQVAAAGWAGLGGVSSGDLIQRIDGQPITDLKDFRKVMKAITEKEPKRVVFVVLRGVRTHFQFAEPEWSPNSDDPDESNTPSEASTKE